MHRKNAFLKWCGRRISQDEAIHDTSLLLQQTGYKSPVAKGMALLFRAMCSKVQAVPYTSSQVSALSEMPPVNH